MSQHTVNNKKYGKVTFTIERFPGCCGISVVHHVRFTPNDKLDRNDSIKGLYRWFYYNVLWSSRNFEPIDGEFGEYLNKKNPNWKVNKIIMADRITRNKEDGSIYWFCMSNKNIIKHQINDNPNSRYCTQSFELNRPKNKYTHVNGVCLDRGKVE